MHLEDRGQGGAPLLAAPATASVVWRGRKVVCGLGTKSWQYQQKDEVEITISEVRATLEEP